MPYDPEARIRKEDVKLVRTVDGKSNSEAQVPISPGKYDAFQQSWPLLLPIQV